jgi:hypothetical protein
MVATLLPSAAQDDWKTYVSKYMSEVVKLQRARRRSSQRCGAERRQRWNHAGPVEALDRQWRAERVNGGSLSNARCSIRHRNS